jgi:RHS repeat-associated protein
VSASGGREQMTVPTYSASGNVAGNFSYAYDAAGRPTLLTNPAGDTFSWTYLANNWLASQTSTDAGNSLVDDTTYTYNALGEVTELTNAQNTSGSQLWSQFGGTGTSAMIYNALGDRTQLTASMPGATGYSGAVKYSYDGVSRLTGEVSPPPGSGFSGRNGGYSNTFAYDAASNPVEMRVTSPTISYNADDQFSSSSYAYDGNGNPTTYGGDTVLYDPENRVTKMRSGSTVELEAGYGYDGLRAWRSEPSNALAYFLYDGDTPVVQLAGTGSNVGQVNVVNTFGPNGILSRYSQNFSGGSFERFYAFDPQGDTAEMIAGSGSTMTLLESATYDAYGERAVTPTTYDTDAYSGFGAQYGYFLDIDMNLELLGHRYYDPAMGRLLNRDPIGYNGGANLYGYAEGQPIDQSDPQGLNPIAAALPRLISAAGRTAVASDGALGGPENPYADYAALTAALCVLGNAAGNSIGDYFFGPQTYPVIPALPISLMRGRKGLRPDPTAQGPHCTWRPGHWAEWQPETNPLKAPKSPWKPGPRYDQTGSAHNDIPTPHVHLPGVEDPVPGTPEDRMKE